ncbi:MAG: hypothetical protein AAGI14_06060 [Pseudomonadota bacterium]
MFGTDIVEYIVPAAPGETFTTFQMQAKKLELDDQARGIVPVLQGYIADYEAAYKAVDTSTMSDREKLDHSSTGFSAKVTVKRWEKAIAELEQSD